jgi:hypothetical protein
LLIEATRSLLAQAGLAAWVAAVLVPLAFLAGRGRWVRLDAAEAARHPLATRRPLLARTIVPVALAAMALVMFLQAHAAAFAGMVAALSADGQEAPATSMLAFAVRPERIAAFLVQGLPVLAMLLTGLAAAALLPARRPAAILALLASLGFMLTVAFGTDLLVFLAQPPERRVWLGDGPGLIALLTLLALGLGLAFVRSRRVALNLLGLVRPNDGILPSAPPAARARAEDEDLAHRLGRLPRPQRRAFVDLALAELRASAASAGGRG